MKSREELIALCRERGIRGYSGKKKVELLALLTPATATAAATATAVVPAAALAVPAVKRLNYIGSKYQLLEWITAAMREKTGWGSFAGRRVADLFAGTGIVSYHFRGLGAAVHSNDAELYSSIIAQAFTCSTYTAQVEELVGALNGELAAGRHSEGAVDGFITRVYSPHAGCERMFFTVDNARRIDYLRSRLAELRDRLTVEENAFLLASLLMSADAVSNVPAVYGCFLKKFKAKATKTLTLAPVHTLRTAAAEGSRATHSDVLADTFIASMDADILYLDPPYNERQYSKNYFPLNMIALAPGAAEPELRGKTGIPTTCFMSPFCKKGAPVEGAFQKLLGGARYTWAFISYNSESLIPRERMLEILGKYGEVSVVERDYKRFKSFEYNEDVAIREYLFCLRRRASI